MSDNNTAADAAAAEETAPRSALEELESMISALESRVRTRAKEDKEAVVSMKLQMRRVQVRSDPFYMVVVC